MLREHCSREGRDYSEIEKTVQMRFNLGEHGERVEETIEHLHELAVFGVRGHTAVSSTPVRYARWN